MPRFGLLLALGVTLGAMLSCIEQPLIAVERVPATGGASNSHGSGTDGGAGEPGVGGRGNASDGSSVGGASGQEGGTSFWACVAKVGFQCDSNEPCCSGLTCEDHACCKVDGRECSRNGDCCDGSECSTVDNRCRKKASACIPVSETQARCSVDSNCCSGKCDYGDDGVKHCQAIEGCKPIGEAYTDWWDCCSVSFPPKDTCTPANSSCKAAGETCGEDAWDQVLGCCGGTLCGLGADGIKRCRSKALCAPVSGRCNQGADCCSIDGKPARCMRTNTEPSVDDDYWMYYGTCQSCQHVNESCLVDFECCEDEGLTCRSGHCVQTGKVSNATTACIAAGADCSSSSPASGGSTSGVSACCTGLTCDDKTSKCVQKQL